MTGSHDSHGRISTLLLQKTSRASPILAAATLFFLGAAFIAAFATPEAGLGRIFAAMSMVSAIGAATCLVIVRKA